MNSFVLRAETRRNPPPPAFLPPCLALAAAALAIAGCIEADSTLTLRLDSAGNCALARPAETDGKDKIPPLTEIEIRNLIPLLAGFEVNVKIVTPTPIVSANTPRKSERTALWTFDFNDNPNAVVDMQNQPFEVVFEGKGLTLPAVARAAPRK